MSGQTFAKLTRSCFLYLLFCEFCLKLRSYEALLLDISTQHTTLILFLNLALPIICTGACTCTAPDTAGMKTSVKGSGDPALKQELAATQDPW